MTRKGFKQMKKLLMGWMAFMLTISAWAQQSLSGKVLDAKSGEPLVGASVWT